MSALKQGQVTVNYEHVTPVKQSNKDMRNYYKGQQTTSDSYNQRKSHNEKLSMLQGSDRKLDQFMRPAAEQSNPDNRHKPA